MLAGGAALSGLVETSNFSPVLPQKQFSIEATERQFEVIKNSMEVPAATQLYAQACL